MLNSNFFYDLQAREYLPSFCRQSPNRDYPLSVYVDSLSPYTVLSGHRGCVNRLDWNESGDLLASGSDDTTVKIWKPFSLYYKSDTDKSDAICNIQTEHIHNLFGVRFIPGTNDRYLCTGSMDKLVQIQSVDRQCTIKNYQIHTDRVKDVQITPRQPCLFYSVSEDGTIRRFDIRMQDKGNGTVLIKLESNHYNCLKGLSINPIRDYEFAIASGDEYVRIFDIRKENECMSYVVPPHFKHLPNHSNTHTTFVEYSCDGSQIVVTYHGENVYVFNSQSYKHMHTLFDTSNNHTLFEHYKQRGNSHFNAKEYSSAIECYHKAINDVPFSTAYAYDKVFCNMAMCLYHRHYFNDLLLGLYYCDRAIESNPSYAKAYWWKIKLAHKQKLEKMACQTAETAHSLFPANIGLTRLYHKHCKKETVPQTTETAAKKSKKEYDFYQRYTGHCNLKTDIKEATFFGDNYICSGSDDGRVFIWDRVSGALVNILSNVDSEVVNTVRRHPHFPILAMSGIDSTIKIWQPSCVQSDHYTKQHKIPFLNLKEENIVQNGNGNENDMLKIVQENQDSLSQPPSQQIDLSTLLFWANLIH